MKYSLELLIDYKEAYQLLKPETSRFSSSRAIVKLTQEERKTKVNIQAKDAVALRATTDSIIQMLKVFEKMKGVK